MKQDKKTPERMSAKTTAEITADVDVSFCALTPYGKVRPIRENRHRLRLLIMVTPKLYGVLASLWAKMKLCQAPDAKHKNF